jgi:hypothetical protein
VGNIRIDTWKGISKYSGFPVRTLIRFKAELLASGTIFYILKRVERADGSGMKARCQKVVCCFPRSFDRWLALKSGKGEMVTPDDRMVDKKSPSM